MNSRNSPVTRNAVCSPMSTALSPMRSMQRETTIIRSRHASVRPVDQLVELGQRVRPLDVAAGERVERDAHHLLRAVTHLGEPLDELPSRLEIRGELRQLRDRHALVANAFEVDRVVQDREDEPEIRGHRPLLGEKLRDRPLDLVVAKIDLVVEGDDLVAELDVLRVERIEHAAQRAQDDGTELLQIGLEGVQALLVLDSGHQPKRPVT